MRPTPTVVRQACSQGPGALAVGVLQPLQCPYGEFGRASEIARLGMGRGQDIEIADPPDSRRRVRAPGELESALGVAHVRRGVGGQQPGRREQRVRIVGLDLDGGDQMGQGGCPGSTPVERQGQTTTGRLEVRIDLEGSGEMLG